MKQRIIRAGLILIFAAAGLFAGCSAQKDQAELVRAETPAETAETEPPETQAAIRVHICGAVAFPGVYTLTGDARVKELVDLAGGFTAEAARDALNLARPLSDGEKVTVPCVWETDGAAAEPGGEPESAGEALLNINTASLDELVTLPGIGEAKAQAIIDYREEQGPFAHPEDIMLVSGIKEAVYKKIRGKITV